MGQGIFFQCSGDFASSLSCKVHKNEYPNY